MKIQDKRVVSIHYRLTNDAGEELDSSTGGDPLAYLHGSNSLIPGLESALAGQSAGDKFKVTVQPTDAYGEISTDLVQVVPIDAFDAPENVKPGVQFQAQGPDGQVQLITVREVSDAGVTIDANHPLAGQVLHFDVSVEEVREASEEEIAHGHVH
ncbi:MAG: peptidylprolyl isomerase [Gammaproteobacteria bacterium]